MGSTAYPRGFQPRPRTPRSPGRLPTPRPYRQPTPRRPTSPGWRPSPRPVTPAKPVTPPLPGLPSPRALATGALIRALPPRFRIPAQLASYAVDYFFPPMDDPHWLPNGPTMAPHVKWDVPGSWVSAFSCPEPPVLNECGTGEIYMTRNTANSCITNTGITLPNPPIEGLPFGIWRHQRKTLCPPGVTSRYGLMERFNWVGPAGQGSPALNTPSYTRPHTPRHWPNSAPYHPIYALPGGPLAPAPSPTPYPLQPYMPDVSPFGEPIRGPIPNAPTDAPWPAPRPVPVRTPRPIAPFVWPGSPPVWGPGGSPAVPVTPRLPPGQKPLPGVGPGTGGRPVGAGTAPNPHFGAVAGSNPARPSGPRDRKMRGSTKALAILAEIAHTGTEAVDVVEALYDALPAQYRLKRSTQTQRARAVAQHWDRVDVAKALNGILYNGIEDAIVGRSIARAKRFARRHGLNYSGFVFAG